MLTSVHLFGSDRWWLDQGLYTLETLEKWSVDFYAVVGVVGALIMRMTNGEDDPPTMRQIMRFNRILARGEPMSMQIRIWAAFVTGLVKGTGRWIDQQFT